MRILRSRSATDSITLADIQVGDMLRATGALKGSSFLAATVNVGRMGGPGGPGAEGRGPRPGSAPAADSLLRRRNRSNELRLATYPIELMNFREQFAGWLVAVSLSSVLDWSVIGHRPDLPGNYAGRLGTSQVSPSTQTLPSAPSIAGGTIRGTVKAGNVPLPGVSVTATNTLTGKKFTTTTDVTGAYEMTIPQNGRYVVRAELAAFALATKEALLNATSHQQQADFSMVLASRAEQQEQREQAMTRQSGGAQSLALHGRCRRSAAGGQWSRQPPAQHCPRLPEIRTSPAIPSQSPDKPEPPIPSPGWATFAKEWKTSSNSRRSARHRAKAAEEVEASSSVVQAAASAAQAAEEGR